MRLAHAPWSAAALLCVCLLSLSSLAFAKRYPPGTVGGIMPGPYPDTLNIINLQSPSVVPSLATLDTCYGIGGIITGFDPKPTGYGFYLQNSNGSVYNGIEVFTGTFNKKAAPWNFAIGDSVVCYGRRQEFMNGTELEGYDGVQGTDDCIVREVSSGNALPPFFVGTTTQLNWLATNAFGEQYEGMLVKINGPLHVARVVGVGTNSFLAVSNAAPSDTIMIDGSTLTTFPAPALNTNLDWIQGIYEQRTTYRIQLRDGNDIALTTPPNVIDAYPVAEGDIRVVFDRSVTSATATAENNYSLASLGTVQSAVMDGTQAVLLTITNSATHGAIETLTVTGVAGVGNGLAMTSAQSRVFVNGVLSCAEVQAPNPDSLVRPLGCLDMSRFAGNNGQESQGLFGTRCTVTGVMQGRYAASSFLADASGGKRSGLQVFSPPISLEVGRRYLVVGAVQEFFGETELGAIVEARDLGAVSAPAPMTPPMSAMAHVSCDALQSADDGEDWEGTLVRVDYGRVVLAAGLATPPTYGFHIASLSGLDTLFVSNFNSVLTPFVPPALGALVRVTGVLTYVNGSFRICPRSWSDVEQIYQFCALNVSVSGDGQVTKSPDAPEYPQGTLVTLTAQASPGNRFVGWAGDTASEANPLALQVSHAWNLVAIFEAVQGFTLFASADTGGTVAVTPNLVAFAPGDTVRVAAVPDPGCVFASWSGDTLAFANPLILVMRRNWTLVARFLTGSPDLAVTAPPGWAASIVPRNDSTVNAASTAVPGELLADGASTYLSVAVAAARLDAPADWGYSLHLDGQLVGMVPLALDPELASPTYTARRVGPLSMTGGWHTLSGMADASNLLMESDEENNAVSTQWLWRPPGIVRGTDYTKNCPPEVGSGPRPNCDAVSFVRDPRYAWVVATGNLGANDKYLLSVCDDYVGPTNGLTHSLAHSVPEIGQVDFVTGSSTTSPAQLYAVVTRSQAPEARPYHIQYSDSRGAFSDVGTGVWAGRVLEVNQLAQVFELYFEDVAPKYLALRYGQAVGIAFEVFDQSVAGKFSSAARGMSLCTGAGYDSLVYVPNRIGWHTVVIYRQGLDRSAIPYTFLSQDHAVLSAGSNPVPSRLDLSPPWPNPGEDRTSFQLALPLSVRAGVHVYDVSGRRVATLCDEVLPAGTHGVRWDCRGVDGRRVSPGLYLVRANVGAWQQTRRVIVR